MKNSILATLTTGTVIGVALIAFGIPTFAQSTSGDLTGTVLDAMSAVVPNAMVTATNESTGVKTSTTTTSAGEYRLSNLLPGQYDIAVSATGFAPAEVRGVGVQLNQVATSNVTLKVGAVSQTVDVVEQTVAIDTSTAQIQNTFETQQMENVPLASGISGVINLSLLQAGVTTSGGVGLGTGPSVGGQRPRNNNFTVEGIDNNNKSVSGPLVQPPNDAVSEFSVLSNQFSPEYGHSSGGQFNQIIKSGSNSFHGMAYEYFQNRNLNSADNLDAIEGNPLHPRFDNNRFGGNIGGPIKKNKLFFFFDWEYSPIGQSASIVNNVPTAAGYSALLAIPGVNVNNVQTMQKYLGAAAAQTETAYVNPGVYLANTPGATTSKQALTGAGGALVPGTTAIPTGTIASSLPNFQNTDTGLASIDYTLSDRDQLRGRFILSRNGQIDTNGFPAAFFQTLPINNYLTTISEYHNFSPSMINELRLGYSRFSQTYTVPALGFTGLDQFPSVNVFEGSFGSFYGPDPNAPQYTIQNTYQLNDSLSWTRGKHSLKFGFDGISWISPQQFIQRSRGDYEWNYLSDYAFDYYPDFIAQRSIGGNTYSGNQYLYGIHGNDSWKLRPNLTLNIGLRWEYLTVPIGEQLQTLNAVSSVPGLITFGKPVPQKDAFMPRIGIAYSPGTSGNTSIRAGFGENYDVLPDNFGLLTEPPQFNTTVDCTGGPATGCLAAGGPGAGFLANGGIRANASAAVPTVAELRAGTGGFVPDQTRPKSIQWNLGFQRVFARNYTLDSEYIGTRGINLPVQDQLNRQSVVNASNALPVYLTTPSQATLNSLTSTQAGLNASLAARGNIVPAYLAAGFTGIITSYQPWGNSTYHGWANTLTRRFSNNLQFTGAYTWSHNIDDSTAEVFSTYTTPRRPQDPRNLGPDRSNSALDHRNRFTFEANYNMTAFGKRNWLLKNIVGNWQISPVYQYQSGTWYTVQSGVDANLNGDSAGDRTFVNINGQPGIGSGTTALKNSAGDVVAFVAANPNARYITAPKGTLPNGGRNTSQLRPINDIDINFGKNIAITERYKLQFGLRAFNLFNHPQYIGGYISDVRPFQPTTSLVHNFLIPTSPIFADPTQAFSSNPRTMQLTAKFIF